MIDVSVILVNYNTKQMTSECIASIKEHTKRNSYEIIMVDNASKDGSVEFIRNAHPDVRVVINTDNEGFGRANNKGASVACGKYLFILNTDTLLRNDAIAEFVDFCEKNGETTGAVGGWLIDGKGDDSLSAAYFTTLKNASEDYWVLLKNKFRKNKFKCEKYIINPSSEAVKDVEVVIGADIFVRKSIFDEVGGFDPDFFMYHEEMHMCHKIIQKGYKNYIIKGPEVIHLCGGSSKENINKTIMMDRSLFIYFKKIGIDKLPLSFRMDFMWIRKLYFWKNKYSKQDRKLYTKTIKDIWKKY